VSGGRLCTSIAWLALLMACSPRALAAEPEAPAQQVVVPEVTLGGDWVIVEESPRELVLRLGDSPHGVRVVLAETEGGRRIGVAPIHDGRTLELRDGDVTTPVFAWPFPDHPLTAASVEVEGPDLVVRLQGPPLQDVTDHPDAPADPVLCWVRIRPRGSTWRFALRGVHRITVPALDSIEYRGVERVWEDDWGWFAVQTDAPAITGHQDGTRLVWDTSPSIDLAQPYPKTGITWTPR